MLIQFPRANNDLLILAPSIILMPLLFVLEALSDPAKSIKESFPILSSASIPASLSLCSQIIYKTAWDLDEVSLAPVASTCLFRLPKLWIVSKIRSYIRRSKISSGVSTSISDNPATCTPLTGSSLRSKTSEETMIKSLIYSLYISRKETLML